MPITLHGGPAALEPLLEIFPEWRPFVLIGDEPEQLAKFVPEHER